MQTQIATAPYRIHRYPSQLIESWTLRNGQRATLRPVLPQDDVSEQAFVAALSVASRRNRFHGAVNGLSTARAEAMTNIDYQSHMGFVVTVMEGDTERVIADARYVMNDDGDSAEFAVVVADAWHGLGLGRRLISALCKCAHRAGARWLYGEVLAGNRDMLVLMQRCGFSAVPHPGDDALVKVERSVAEPAGAAQKRTASFFGTLGRSLAQWMRPSGTRVQLKDLSVR
ncbi:MAG: GNAT family N-acetyltransferase [Burkholderiales bacterium]|nr:GNAT family N-acetyltransferase [Burkholderiales bacterium]